MRVKAFYTKNRPPHEEPVLVTLIWESIKTRSFFKPHKTAKNLKMGNK